MDNSIVKAISDHFNLKDEALDYYPQKIEEIGKMLISTLKNKNKLMWCGNGGSAAQAEHLSAELLGGLNKIKIDPFFSLCLNCDSSFITAWSNDSSFDEIFARQVKAFGKKGDVLILLTTSGNSMNLINAAKECKDLGVKVVSFTGNDGGSVHSDNFLIIYKMPSWGTTEKTFSIRAHAANSINYQNAGGGAEAKFGAAASKTAFIIEEIAT